MEDRSSPTRRRGFTLVEILTVVVIIGILVGLVTAAVGPVKNTVKNWRMKSEILQLSLAMEQVKTQLGGGDYPPDGTDQADTLRFLRRAFPRAIFDPTNTSVFFPVITPANAMVFWLAGPNGNGFSADPTNPFDLNPATPLTFRNPPNPSRIGPFFDFDKTRLRPATVDTADNYIDKLSATGHYALYFPQNDNNVPVPVAADAAAAPPYSPYLYFKAVAGKYSTKSSDPASPPENSTENYHFWRQRVEGVVTVIVPFKDSRSPIVTLPGTTVITRAWLNPQSFQILCPGLDGLFGVATIGSYIENPTTGESADATGRFAPIYPDGLNYADAMKDDVTNFSNGKLENDMP